MLGCGLEYAGSTSQELIAPRVGVLSLDCTLESRGNLLYVLIRHPRLINQTLWGGGQRAGLSVFFFCCCLVS